MYHENWLAKTEIADEKERSTKAVKALTITQKERDRYKTQRDELSVELDDAKAECKQLRQVAEKSRKRAVVAVFLALAVFFACSFAVWSTIRVSKYKTFTQEVKAVVKGNPLSIDVIPDSVRYDYEDLFGTKW